MPLLLPGVDVLLEPLVDGSVLLLVPVELPLVPAAPIEPVLLPVLPVVLERLAELPVVVPPSPAPRLQAVSDRAAAATSASVAPRVSWEAFIWELLGCVCVWRNEETAARAA
ncbi:MAG: hypothetical protein ACXWC6_11915 [Ramlibacter sp.]